MTAAIDGMHTPDPRAVRPSARWPWVVLTGAIALVLAGGVAFSPESEPHQPPGSVATVSAR